MSEVTVARLPATASATLPQTFVDATIVIGPSTGVAGADSVLAESVELHALSVRAAAQVRPSAAVSLVRDARRMDDIDVLLKGKA
jgi:hypothetical protein